MDEGVQRARLEVELTQARFERALAEEARKRLDRSVATLQTKVSDLQSQRDRLRREVADWEARLAPLAGGLKPVAPPKRVWQAIERRLDRAFAFGIERAGRFVQQQDRRIAENRTRDGDARKVAQLFHPRLP